MPPACSTAPSRSRTICRLKKTPPTSSSIPTGRGERLVDGIGGLWDRLGRGEHCAGRAGENFLGARKARQAAGVEHAIVRFGIRFGLGASAGQRRQKDDRKGETACFSELRDPENRAAAHGNSSVRMMVITE